MSAKPPLTSRFTVILGTRAGTGRVPGDWPFVRDPRRAARTDGTIHVSSLHLAFPSGQTAGTRLVLTQSTYQLQRWLDWLDAHPGATIVAHATRAGLERNAPDAFAGRGPWTRIDIVDGNEHAVRRVLEDPSYAPVDAGRVLPDPPALHEAFTQGDPDVRLDACERAVAAAPDEPALRLALASTFMELLRLDEAAEHLEQAARLAPDWEAVHFERGKLWLRTDATERAAEAFAEAARLMPSFAAASSNLGAALGELDRPEEAFAALERALAHDPRGYPVLNNIGAVLREMGRLDEAAAAFRQVITLAPRFVFGAYNLAHTQFLQGRFGEARRTYEEAYARDPQQNARQACRLAVARAADGDAAAALTLLAELSGRVAPPQMREMAGEAESTLTALSAVPGIDGKGLLPVLEAVRRYSSYE